MNKKLDSFKYGAFVLFLLQIVLAIILEHIFYMRFASIMLICIVIDAIYVLWRIYSIQNDEANKNRSIKSLVDDSVSDAIEFGDIGMITFDDDYTINWMSDLFTKRDINFVGEKVTGWISELSEVFNSDVDNIKINYLGRDYLVSKKSTGGILYFKDITDKEELKTKLEDNQTVIGLIYMDNYAETIQYEDEQKIALINSNVRQKIIDWCKENGMVARRLRNDKFVVITNKKQYELAYNNRFSILDEVRREAQNLEVAITLSMSFAMGSNDLCELDELANDLLELAQNRGGDQVAIRSIKEDVKFVGGATENSERRSGVRIRVMAQSIRGLMENSDKVFVTGHAVADFDSMAGCIGVSRIALSLGKEAYIVSKGGVLESKLEEALNKYNDKLSSIHKFISEEQALNIISDKSLLVMVDHHNADMCFAKELLARAKRCLIIDHHRRSKDDNVKASMVYLEASSSSTAELITELLEYQPNKIELIEAEANIIMAGMVLDTNHFRNRSGTRTFEAASKLRDLGADPREVDELLKRNYKEFEMQNKILTYSNRIFDKYVIAAIEDEDIYTRAQLSMAADFLLTIQDVKASFVIGYIGENEVALSARSAGEVNVQVIAEAMDGGGHFSASALQRKNTTVMDVKDELTAVLEEYEREEKNKNESNPIN